MLSSGVFETRGAKLIAALAVMLALVIFQVALQAKPAHAWEVNMSIKGAGKITEVTSRNLISTQCSPGGTGGFQSPNTTPTGQVGATCSPGSPDGNYPSFDIIEYKAEPKTGFTFVGWRNSDDSATYNTVLCDGSNNQPSYNGTNCRFQIFENLKAQAVFQDTQAPPTPTITGMSPSSGITNGGISFSFSSASDPTFKEFQCSIDSSGGPWQSCSSGRIWFLTEGFHTIYVRSVDFSGNVSLGTDSQSFTVDQTPPNTTLLSNVGPAPDTATQDNNPTFAFSSSEPTNATFECNLMGPGFTNAAFSPCNVGTNTQTTKSYANLKDGTYTFKVRAKDQAGNVDTTYDASSRTWTINNTPTVLENSLTPIKLATNVSRTTMVSASFSEEMAAISLEEPDNTSKTFKLQMYNKKTKKWVTISATIALTNTNTTATLDPYGATEGGVEKPLAANKKFRGIITTGAKDADGNPLAKNFVWTFKTGSS